MTKRTLEPTSFGQIPELPWQVEVLLTVVSTVKKLHFRNVGFELNFLNFQIKNLPRELGDWTK